MFPSEYIFLTNLRERSHILRKNRQIQHNFLKKLIFEKDFHSFSPVLNVTLLDSRSIEERSVKSIRIDGENNKTHLELNNSLPPKLIKGKISINKWEILLNINHPGENRINTTYQVIRDFTPNLNIPLMKGNISKNEAVYNEAISKIDEAIKKLYDKTELDL